MLDVSDVSPEILRDKKGGPRIIQAYQKLETEKGQVDGYHMLLRVHAQSPFRDFESYLGNVVGFD